MINDTIIRVIQSLSNKMQKNNSALTVAIFQEDIHSFIPSHAVRSILFSSQTTRRGTTSATRHTQQNNERKFVMLQKFSKIFQWYTRHVTVMNLDIECDCNECYRFFTHRVSFCRSPFSQPQGLLQKYNDTVVDHSCFVLLVQNHLPLNILTSYFLLSRAQIFREQRND